MKASDIQFKVGKKKHSFTIIHNLPEQFGLNIECALNNWLARTNDYSAGSLCDYIESKDPTFTAFTEEGYNDYISNI